MARADLPNIKNTIFQRFKGIIITTIIILIIFLAVTIKFEILLSSHAQEIEETNKQYFLLRENNQNIKEAKLVRINFFKKKLFAENGIRYSYAASNFIRELSLITGPETRLVRLEITPKIQGFSFIIHGNIKNQHPDSSRKQISKFDQKLKGLTNIFQTDYITVKSEDGSGRLFFKFNGEIEVE